MRAARTLLLIVTSILFSGLVNAGPTSSIKREILPNGLIWVAEGSCTSSQESAAQSYIIAWGYRCDSVSFCMQSTWDVSIRVTCNNNRYAYRLRDKGGNWVVELD